MPSYQLFISNVEADLDPEAGASLYPTYQAADRAKLETVVDNDISTNFSLPSTARNDKLLGYAAEELAPGRIPYRKLPARLVCAGMEVLPRAILYVDGYEAGRYQCQLAGSVRSFVEALGDKTLQDLDFSRFDHLRTLDDVAERITPEFYAANGWGYELYDRGKVVRLDNFDYGEILPSLSAKLIWSQMLAETGFTASELDEPLWERLNVPATTLATYAEAFRKARKLLAGIEEGNGIDSRATADRGEKALEVPYQDLSYEGAPFTVPSAGNFQPGALVNGVPVAGRWRADKTCYVSVKASTVVDMTVASIGGRTSARINLFVNGRQIQQGEKQETTRDKVLAVQVTSPKLLLQQGDEMYAVLKMKNEAGVNKWGFQAFTSAVYFVDGQQLPRDVFQVDVLEEIPPGGPARLTDYLPAISQLDFFRSFVRLMGLVVTTDDYLPHLTMRPGYQVLRNAPAAWDWTDKRDAPADTAGRPRTLNYRFGSYARRNLLQWKEDSANGDEAKGYADAVLVAEDENLPAEQTLFELPFAATVDSTAEPLLVRIPTWERTSDALTPFDETYKVQKPVPRLTLRGQVLANIVVTETLPQPDRNDQPVPPIVNRRERTTLLSYFAQAGADAELDLQRYVAGAYYRDLLAMLTDTRYVKERYRLSVLDVQRLRANYCIPVWDAVLGGYYYVNRIVEHSPDTSTLVELVRLHPAYLPEPTPGAVAAGEEFYSEEFFGDEWY